MGAQIALVRIDDRLIHGQVVTAWIREVPTDLIVIVDDGVAKDMFMQRVLRSTAPSGSTAQAMSVADTVDFINDPANEGCRMMLIAKGPEAIEALIDAGVEIDSVILGGMGIRAGRTRLNRNVFASADEISCMQRLEERGTKVGYQLVPQETFVPLSKLV